MSALGALCSLKSPRVNSSSWAHFWEFVNFLNFEMTVVFPWTQDVTLELRVWVSCSQILMCLQILWESNDNANFSIGSLRA